MNNLAKELNSHHSHGKRYTYFPPVSTWKESSVETIEFEDSSPWSLYLHLPFCRELCTFCGCNIKITKDEHEHMRYVDALIKEYESLNFSVPTGPFTLILGGGSPNALSYKALEKLKTFILNEFPVPADSLCEIDPRTFNQTQAELFFELGIKRFSFGVQDFDLNVLKNINRNQTLEQLEKTTNILKHRSTFGIDLLWGMPLQDNDPFHSWQKGLEALNPDWINYYPMAAVPWLAPVQNAYGDFSLPSQERKYELYSEGSKIFEMNNYTNIGMGHFLKDDSILLKKFKNQDLTRSVSGLFYYKQSQVLGLGVSAISRNKYFQWQNQKIIDRYLFSINKGISPIIKRHDNNEQDISMAKIIEDVILERFYLDESDQRFPTDWFTTSRDGQKRKISIKGRHFKKNILQVLENDLMVK